MALQAVVEGSGPTVVLVHGFTQTHRSWDRVAALLSPYRRVVRVDLPGHGESSAVRASLAECARLVADAGGDAVYAGYSLGGRVCLRLALDRPDRVRALVLIGASPGIADDDERALRRALDERRAAEVERVGVPRFVQDWLAQPMFAGVPPEATTERLSNTTSGLASSLRLAGAGAMAPLWGRLGELRMPVMLVVGERDAAYRAIAERMRSAIGRDHCRLAVVRGAGHAAHLEAPGMVEGLLERFLVRHAPVA